MLSVVVLPGPDQLWPVRDSRDRLALQLPCGNLTFMVGALPETGSCWPARSCPPSTRTWGPTRARAGEQHPQDAAFASGAAGEGGVNLSRRRLFSGRRGDPVGDTQR